MSSELCKNCLGKGRVNNFMDFTEFENGKAIIVKKLAICLCVMCNGTGKV